MSHLIPFSPRLNFKPFHCGVDEDVGKDDLMFIPDDVFVEICRYVTVIDVLSLRRVSRKFFILTYTPIIWKRLLYTSRLPVPPLPPTSSNSLANIPLSICEQILRRACAIQKEWKREHCRSAHNWFDAFNPVHYMTILPGGKYLVIASVELATDKSTVTVWDLEFPSDDPFKPDRRRAALARLVVPGPVLEMKAKYMSIFGKKGIVVAVFCQNESRNKTHFWSVFSIKLETLEEYAKVGMSHRSRSREMHQFALKQPPPFKVLIAKPTSSEIFSMNLESMDGMPYIVLIRYRKEIILQHLETGRRTFIIPHDPREYLEPEVPIIDIVIRQIKLLPAQHQLIVIREVELEAGSYPVIWFEFYDLPPSGSVQRKARCVKLQAQYHLQAVDFFEISDNCYQEDISFYDESINPIISSQLTPPSICIWTACQGTVHYPDTPTVVRYLLEPKPRSLSKPIVLEESGEIVHETVVTYHYDFANLKAHYCVFKPFAILGGCNRAVWVLPKGTQRVDYEERLDTESEHLESEDLAIELLRFNLSLLPDRSPNLSLVSPEELARLELPVSLQSVFTSGMQACAFDESMGRLVIAPQNGSLIHVLDYSDRFGARREEDLSAVPGGFRFSDNLTDLL